MKNLYFFWIVFLPILFFSQTSERILNTEKWLFSQEGKNTFQPAKVPGNVHLDLMRNQLILDPFKDDNEKKIQWIESENWIYKTDFYLSEQELKNKNIELIFDGLDTFAAIYLNGKLLKSTDNMFRQWEISVKPYLIKGKNNLEIRFKSSIVEGKKRAEKIPFQLPENPRSLVRKAQYQFGWDWGPRLVTAGIWKNVKLKFWNYAKMGAINLSYRGPNENREIVNLKMDFIIKNPGKYELFVNDEPLSANFIKGNITITSVSQLKNVKFWNPNGMGNQDLTPFNFKLYRNGQLIEEKTETIGLRTIELVQKKDEKGSSFQFEVNGKPFYIKGANWIPADFFTTRVSKDKYKKFIEDAKKANINMLRVWGGGIYEDDEFYKACDENGILVWQDFMFAGTFYPSDTDFANNVKEEVKHQVKRLQNHPSIALWCGNNEIDEAIVNWGYQKQFGYSKEDSIQVWNDYRKIFHEVIPEALNKAAPWAKPIYWPSSPSIGWGHKESLLQGDSHYWGVWWGNQPFEVYNEKLPRFASEYGFQGIPDLNTSRYMFSKDPDLSLNNSVIKIHQKHPKGWQIIDEYMKRDYKVPTSFEKYTYVSQLLQARGMQIAIEAHRRSKPYNMGTLYWQYNDCWPVVSWSSIDYLGNWKASQYQAKRSFEPFLFSMEQKENQYQLFVINDENRSYSGELELELIDFNGKVNWSFNKSVSVYDNASEVVYAFGDEIFKGSGKNSTFLKATLKDSDQLKTQHFFFCSPKEMILPKPTISVKKISDYEIEISTDVLTKNVWLQNASGNLSDNYFDLLPNEKKRITCEKPIQLTTILSLYDTMN